MGIYLWEVVKLPHENNKGKLNFENQFNIGSYNFVES
jgi:hypothetical protein